MTLSRLTPDMTFGEASASWLASRSLDEGVPNGRRARFIRLNTYKSYRAYIDSLNLFFRDLQLSEIGLAHLRRYQVARTSGREPFLRYRRPQDALAHKAADGANIPPKGKTPCPASPKKCNQELALLRTLMNRAGCWSDDLNELYEPFIEDVTEVPRSLSLEEQERWLKVALTDQRWWIVYWYSVLAFETSMSTNEMRSLRIGDVNLAHSIVSVPPDGAKNRYRARTIPIVSPEARWCLEQLLARAKDMGGSSPFHFLFPFRDGNRPADPSKPMTVSGIKRQWEEVRSASGLAWFRPYDTRHTAITRWAESGMPIAEIMAMAGHVSERMTKHYTHISVQAKRRALEAAMPRVGPPLNQASGAHAPFYIQKSVQARKAAPGEVQGTAERLRPLQRPPVPPSSPMTPDLLLEPAVQAEIARQVALALQALAQRGGAQC